MAITADIRDNNFFQEAFTLGVEEGVEQGEAKALRRLSERRFGTLPEALAQQLSKLNGVEIEAAFDRAFDAKQIEDVFGERQN